MGTGFLGRTTPSVFEATGSTHGTHLRMRAFSALDDLLRFIFGGVEPDLHIHTGTHSYSKTYISELNLRPNSCRSSNSSPRDPRMTQVIKKSQQ